MRVEVNFKAKEVPIYYRMGMLSLIKEALSKANPAYYHEIFSDNPLPKPFAYAVYLKNFNYKAESIELDGFTLFLTSSNYEFMMHFFNGISQMKTYRYLNFEWEIERIRMLPERSLCSSQAVFKTVSPLLIESKDGKPVFPHDASYEQEFNYYANLVVSACLGRSLRRPLMVRPLQMKKVVIKESNRIIREGDHPSQILYFTVFKGHLYIEGDQEDLLCLYQNGISKRRSFGFGMLDIEMEGVRT
ncbi:CRISPR-associated endoribonuclease Cas6 [Aneurinibacillus sp. BA2021]|nr:CRISPR-associated endoribonuclease Cas6 [Aneurinibacillus sp. BA2021]